MIVRNENDDTMIRLDGKFRNRTELKSWGTLENDASVGMFSDREAVMIGCFRRVRHAASELAPFVMRFPQFQGGKQGRQLFCRNELL